MKNGKIIYWVSTGIVSGMMIFSGVNYFTSPDIAATFVHLGFPNYFRIELGILKILGALALALPMLPPGIKGFTYAGFGITFMSAVIAHASVGDPVSRVAPPAIFLVILIVSYLYRKASNRPWAYKL